MKPRLAVVCLPGLDTFVKTRIPIWRESFVVRMFIATGDEDIAKAFEFAGADGTIYCEWANDSAVAVSRWPADPKPRVVVRLESYEAFGPWLEHMHWDRVDAVSVPGSHIVTIAQDRCPALREKTLHVIPNGIDLSKFEYAERKPGKNIGVAGYINHKKGPMLWLQVLQRLHEHHLHVAGSFQDLRYKWYLLSMAQRMGLHERFHLDGWVDDIAGWWADKNYVLSCSPHEGHAYNLLEAAAMGIRPVIHRYFGSEKQYPKHWLWDVPEEAAGIIDIEGVPESQLAPFQRYDSAQYRTWAEEFTVRRAAEAHLPLLKGTA